MNLPGPFALYAVGLGEGRGVCVGAAVGVGSGDGVGTSGVGVGGTSGRLPSCCNGKRMMSERPTSPTYANCSVISAPSYATASRVCACEEGSDGSSPFEPSS